MQNRPVIGFTFQNIALGVDSETRARYIRWSDEVSTPLAMKVSGVLGHDRYQAIKESFEYPQMGTIAHYKNLEAWHETMKSPERTAIREDMSANQKRGIRDGIWSAVYELVKGFRSEPTPQGSSTSTMIENAPVIHFEAFRLSADEQEKYIKWLNDYGFDFIPLFMKFPGFKGYDVFKDTGCRTMESRESEYPPYLSLLYVENLKCFEDYTKSHELFIFQKSLRSVFSRGLNYKWDVQYQLMKSWRK